MAQDHPAENAFDPEALSQALNALGVALGALSRQLKAAPRAPEPAKRANVALRWPDGIWFEPPPFVAT